MAKRIATAVLFVLIFINQIKAQFTDDFERYNYTQRISPQSLNWITWEEDPVSGTGYIEEQDGIIANKDHPNYGQSKYFAASGKQALFIGENELGSIPQDVVLDLHNKSIGKWKLTWKMYLPKRKSKAYYNFQENTPVIGNGNWAVQVYFDGKGNGRIEDDNGSAIVNFSYPWKEWIKMVHIIDLDGNTIKIKIISNGGTNVIYNSNFLSDTQHLGGVNFFAIPNDINNNSIKNTFYIDDVAFKKKLPIEDVYIRDNGQWEDINGNILSGEPDNSYEVIIREPYSITAGETLNCLNLIFENTGRLLVPDQGNVVISGDLMVPSANKIIIENGGSFVMLNNTAVIDMPDSSSFTYTRTSKAMLGNDYTYWSSPVENMPVSDFGSPYVYTFETANYKDLYSGLGYPQTSGTPDQHDDNGDDWIYENNSSMVVSGKGYAVLKSGNSGDHTVNFKGVPYNGFISIPVFLSGDDSVDDDDWNLLGNPYPSAIDARVFIHSNINLSGTIYYWTHNSELGNGYSGPEDKNYNPNDYASFNLSGGVAASTGGEIPNGYIAAGQGFFMDVSQNGVISFNNDMRVSNISNENTQFFKSTNSKEKEHYISDNKNRIWLSFTNEKGVFSQSLIAFIPGASNGFESNYDGLRAGTDLNVKFYSLLGEKELAIQGKPVLKGDEIIQLGFYITKPDQFTISIDKIEGVISDENSNVYLIDNELGVVHDLKNSSYSFSVLQAGYNNERFTIQFKGSSLGIDEKIRNEKKLIITNGDNGFEVNSDRVVESIQIYDMMGRLLISKSPNQQSFHLNASNIKKGTLLIVQAKIDQVIVNKKIVKY